MSNFYDDSRFGVITRKWFGLTAKHGGDVAAGYAFATGNTMVTHVARWYPRGPITIKKVGYMVLATCANASGAVRPVRFKTRGASSSLICQITPSSCTQAQYSRGSSTTFTVSQVKAGEYISIRTASARTVSKGTAVGKISTGTLAFFVDHVPKWDPDGKWDV